MALQAQPTTPVPTQKYDDSTDDFEESAFYGRRLCCFWNFPCYRSRKSNDWERISTSEKEQTESGTSPSWWSEGVNALKKAREWSELAAGPKWKTFIRRFNKAPARSKTGKFQYDPFSYALNFDEGGGQNCQFEDDDRVHRDFSSRYAAIPVQNSQLKEAS